MKDKSRSLRIYNFSHPLLQTEVLSVLGDKYAHALSTPFTMTSDYASADVVLWDGVLTTKNQPAVSKMLEDIKTGKVLLLIGESVTLLKNHPLVKLQNPENLNCVELHGWNVLPEEILAALETCFKKSKHV